jgi:hypothetical protein
MNKTRSVTGPSPTIVCVDCGGVCHLISYPPADHEWQLGDVVAYRCRDCNDRWDIELTEDDVNAEHY